LHPKAFKRNSLTRTHALLRRARLYGNFRRAFAQWIGAD
jgi:hypothetical protein